MNSSPATIGVLASGGLDSSILLAHLLDQGHRVKPFYIRKGLYWQEHELAGLRVFLQAIATPALLELVMLELPLADLYSAGHWSLTGKGAPAHDAPDEAVYLPGRNALLLVKAAVWCQLHGIERLALAPLGTTPFEDAGAQFLADFESALNRGAMRRVQFLSPFGKMNKQQVMTLGARLPLELTFSCISPMNGIHCGRCNKCAERQSAFRIASLHDRTPYDNSPLTTHH
ncbi:MAG: 7-cyano-7-deazaguanine synthase [Pirellulaceae bacterium]|nr:7-cyano-7-deazaguanine synthase [Pirellulaceae bacterium]